ncbi:MAG: proprotein convertase P-domain-containing protein [Pseudomonadota bacterium]
MLAACKAAPDGRSSPATLVAALIMTGSVLDDATSVRIWVYDTAVQECTDDGKAVPDPRATTLHVTDPVTRESGTFDISFEVPEGRRTFYIEVYGESEDIVIATGCTVVNLTGGVTNTVKIWIHPLVEEDADEEPDAVDVAGDEPGAEAIDVVEGDMAVEDLAAEDVAGNDTAELIPDFVEVIPDINCEELECNPVEWHVYNDASAVGIPRTGTLVRSIVVSDCCFTVRDIRVYVNILHNWIGDLTLLLVRPDNRAFPLHKRQGGSDDNIIGEYPTLLTPTVDLCLLTGSEVYGNWRLIVENAGSFGGTLNSWSLYLKGEREYCREDAFYPGDFFPMEIPDNEASGRTSTITVPSDFAVSGVEAYVSISHEYIADLSVTLTSPADTSCTLHDRSGGGANDIIVTYPDPEAPDCDLSVFNGEDASGTWTLKVADMAGGTEGEFNGWILYVH